MHKPAQVELQLDRPQLPYSETLGPIIARGSPAQPIIAGGSPILPEKAPTGALEKNFNLVLYYLQNISFYIIIECKMYYVFLKKKLQNSKHFQITNIYSLI